MPVTHVQHFLLFLQRFQRLLFKGVTECNSAVKVYILSTDSDATTMKKPKNCYVIQKFTRLKPCISIRKICTGMNNTYPSVSYMHKMMLTGCIAKETLFP